MASLVFCVGPMTILGSIQDGLMGDATLLVIKSLMDGFAALALAALIGRWGDSVGSHRVRIPGRAQRACDALQRSLGRRRPADAPWVIKMTATGGVVILSIALLLLDLNASERPTCCRRYSLHPSSWCCYSG